MAKKGCGCILSGFLGVTLCTLALVCVGGWYLYSTFGALDEAPHPLPVPEMSEDTESKIRIIEQKISEIFDHGQAGSITISGDLINTWLRLNRSSDLRFLGEHTWLSFAGERVTAQIAAPLAPIGIEGKYYNGSIVFSGWLRGGKSRFFLHDVLIDGAAGDRLHWLAALIKGRDLSAPLDLESFLDGSLLHRCGLEVKSAQLLIDCSARE